MATNTLDSPTYRGKIYNNLAAAYGQGALPDFSAFNTKLDKEPGYAQKIYQNLEAAYGKEALPDLNEWWNKMNSPDFLTLTGMKTENEALDALNYAIQKVTRVNEIPAMAPVDPESIYDNKLKDAVNTLIRGTATDVDAVTKELSPFINDYRNILEAEKQKYADVYENQQKVLDTQKKQKETLKEYYNIVGDTVDIDNKVEKKFAEMQNMNYDQLSQELNLISGELNPELLEGYFAAEGRADNLKKEQAAVDYVQDVKDRVLGIGQYVASQNNNLPTMFDYNQPEDNVPQLLDSLANIDDKKFEDLLYSQGLNVMFFDKPALREARKMSIEDHRERTRMGEFSVEGVPTPQSLPVEEVMAEAILNNITPVGDRKVSYMEEWIMDTKARVDKLDYQIDDVTTKLSEKPTDEGLKGELEELKAQRREELNTLEKKEKVNDRMFAKLGTLKNFIDDRNAQKQLDLDFTKGYELFTTLDREKARAIEPDPGKRSELRRMYLITSGKKAINWIAESGKSVRLLAKSWNLPDNMTDVQKTSELLFTSDLANDVIKNEFGLRMPTDIDEFIKYEYDPDDKDKTKGKSIHFNGKALLPSIAKLTIQSFAAGGTGALVQGGIRGGLGLVSSTAAESAIVSAIAPRVGTFIGTALPITGNMIDEELRRGLKFKDATMVGWLRGGAEALTEMAFLNEMGFAKSLLRQSGVDIAESASRDVIQQALRQTFVRQYYKLLTGKTMSEGMSKFIIGGQRALAIGVEESLEEVAANLLNGLIDRHVMFNKNYSSYRGEPIGLSSVTDKSFWMKQATTFANTFITMLPQMGTSGYASYHDGYKNFHYGIASSAEQYRTQLHQDYIDKKLSESQYKLALGRLATSETLFQRHKSDLVALPTQVHRAQYFDLRYRREALEREAIAANTSERRKNEIDLELKGINEQLDIFGKAIDLRLHGNPDFAVSVFMASNQQLYTNEYFNNLATRADVAEAEKTFDERVAAIREATDPKLKEAFEKHVNSVREVFNALTNDKIAADFRDQYRNETEDNLNTRREELLTTTDVNEETDIELNAINAKLLSLYQTKLDGLSITELQDELTNFQADEEDILSVAKLSSLVAAIRDKEQTATPSPDTAEEPTEEAEETKTESISPVQERKTKYLADLTDRVNELKSEEEIKNFLDDQYNEDGSIKEQSELNKAIREHLNSEAGLAETDEKGNLISDSFVTGAELDDIAGKVRDAAEERIRQLNSFKATDSKGVEQDFYTDQSVWIKNEKGNWFVVSTDPKGVKLRSYDNSITRIISDFSDVLTERPELTEDEKEEQLENVIDDIIEEVNTTEQTEEELVEIRKKNIKNGEFVPMNPLKTTRQDDENPDDPAKVTWRVVMNKIKNDASVGNYTAVVVTPTLELAEFFHEKAKQWVKTNGVKPTDRAVVIGDKNGNILYFNKEGNVVEKTVEGARPAIGWLPRLDQVNYLDPKEIADRKGMTEEAAKEFIKSKLDELAEIRSAKSNNLNIIYRIDSVSPGVEAVVYTDRKKVKSVAKDVTLMVAEGDYIGTQRVFKGRLYMKPKGSKEWFQVLAPKLTNEQIDLIITLFRKTPKNDKQEFTGLGIYEDFWNRVDYIKKLVYSGGKSNLHFSKTDEVVYYRNDRENKFEVLDINSIKDLKKDQMNLELNTSNYPNFFLQGEAAKDRLREILTNNYRHNVTRSWTEGKITELYQEGKKILSREIDAVQYIIDNFDTHFVGGNPEALNVYIELGERITPKGKGTTRARVAATPVKMTQKELERQIALNQKKVEGRTDDEKYYVINGEKYQRVTSAIESAEVADNEMTKAARIVGTRIDSIIRAFFAGEGVAEDRLEFMTEMAYVSLMRELGNIYNEINNRGEKFLTNNIVLFDEKLKIAGEVDILSIDKEGNVRIYDVKTAKDWSTYKKRYKEGERTKQEQYEMQLSGYSNLFANQYGFAPKALGILPLQLAYDKEGNIRDIKKLAGIPVTYQDAVNKYIPSELAPTTPKVDTKETDPNIEAKKKDIEKRRKEELEFNFGNNIELIASGRTPVIQRQPTYSKKYPNGTKMADEATAIQLVNDYKEINARYDAELAALEGKAKPVKEEVTKIPPEDKKVSETPAADETKKEPTKKKTYKKSSDKKKDDDLLKREMSLTTIPFVEMTPAEMEWFKSVFGEEYTKRRVTLVYRLLNSSAWGTWSRAGITLMENAEHGTLYHEAFHEFSQLYLTKEQKKKMYAEARKQVPELKDKTDLEVEEYLAEDFRNFVLSGGKLYLGNRPVRNSLFDNMIKFIKRVFFGETQIDTIYQKLYKGNFSENDFDYANADFGYLNRAIKLEYNDQPYTLNNQESQELMNSFDGDIADIFEQEGFTLSVLFDKTRRDEVMGRIYNDLQDRWIDYHANLPEGSPLIEKYEVVLDNFSALVTEHQLRSKLIKDFGTVYEFVEEDEGELDEESQEEKRKEEGKMFELTGNEYSSRHVANKETIFLTSTLPRYENGEIVLNSWGRRELMDGTSAWNILAKHLAGTTDYKQFFNKIKALSVKYPEFAHLTGNDELKGRIVNPDSKTMTDAQASLRNKMLQDLSKPRVRAVETVITINKDGTFSVKVLDATKGMAEVVAGDFTYNFQNSRNEFVTVNKDGDVMLNTKKLLETYTQAKLKAKNSGKLRAEFLEKLGFVYSNDAKASQAYKTNILGVPEKRDYVEKVWLGLKELEALQVPITNPIDAISTPVAVAKGKGYAGESNNVRALLEIEASFNEKYESFSVFNSEGSRIYEIQNWNELAYVVNSINNTTRFPKYQDLLKEESLKRFDIDHNPYIKESRWLNSVFILNVDPKHEDFGKRRKLPSGNYVTLSMLNFMGLKITNEEGVASEGLNTTSTYVTDKLLMDINSLLTTGISENIRHGDKSSSFSVRVTSYLSLTNPELNKQKTRMLPVDIGDFVNDKLSTEAREIFWRYFKSEVMRIRDARTKDKDIVSRIKYFSKNAAKFSIFDGILSEKFLKAAERFLDEKYDINALDNEKDARAALTKELEVYFYSGKESQYNKVLTKYLNPLQITPKSVFSKELLARHTPEQLIRAYVVNDFIIKNEQLVNLYGDTAFFKDNDFFKRASKASATGTFAFEDEQLNEYLTGHVNTRLSAKTAGYKVAPESESVRTVVLKDNELPSAYIETYTKLLKEKFNISDELIANIINPYRKMTEGDGQGWITLDAYRIFKIRQGNWYPEHERAYVKVAKGESLTREEMFYFMPIKAQYSGEIRSENSELDKYYVPGFHKFSLMPLVPTVIKGTYMEKIHDKMLKEGIDYALFESSSKGSGFLNKEGQYNNFYADYALRTDATDQEWVVNVGNYAYLKEQVNIEPKLKNEIIYPTQLRKLLFYNMFNMGVPVDVINKYSPAEWLKLKAESPSTAKKESNIYRLYTEYNSNIAKQTEIEKNRIIKELDIKIVRDDAGRIVDYTLDNYEKLAEMLRREFEGRKLPDKTIDFIEVVDGKLKYSLDSSLSRQKIESILMAVANNRLVRQKSSGEALIQVASSGFERFSKEASEDALKTYGSNDLPFYTYDENGNKTNAMKVKIALIGSFKNLLYLKHLDGSHIRTLERLNEMLKSEEWLNKADHRKMITMTGVRIPVQGMNSMEFMEVYEFLPEEAGAAIILPSEIVAKSGGDFDIDKLSVFIPAVRAVYNTQRLVKEFLDQYDGVYTKADLKFMLDNENFENENEEFGIDALTEEERLIAQQFRAFRQSKMDEVRSAEYITDDSKKGLQNKNNELIRQVLERGDNFPQLITPNATFILKDKIYTSITDKLVKEANARKQDGKSFKLSKYPQSAIRNFDESLNQFQANLVGKETLGIAAVNNTFSQLFKQINLTLNDTYKVAIREKDGTVRYETRQVRMWLPHNTDDKGRPVLGQVTNTQNGNTSEIISQSMNGFVDVAKEPWIFYINFGKEVASTVLYLNHLGVDEETLFSYMNQPAIREYVEGLQRKRFLVGRAANPHLYKDLKFYNAKLKSSIFMKLLPQDKAFYKVDKRTNKPILRSAKQVGQALNVLAGERGVARAFNYDYMFDKVGKSYGQLTAAQKVTQAIMLQNFIEMMEQSAIMVNAQSAFNFDTNKDQFIIDAEQRLNDIKNLYNLELFRSEGLDAMVQDTVLKGFANQEFVMKIYKNVLEVTNHRRVNKFVLRQLDAIDPSYRSKVEEKFKRLFKNDFIEYIFQNYVGVKLLGKPTNPYQLQKAEGWFKGKNSMANQLSELIEKYPDLKSFHLVNVLRKDVSKRSGLVNVGLKISKLDSDSINTLYENFQTLINYDKGDGQKNTEIQRFFRNLTLFGFLQSGLNFSRVSFTQVMPDEIYAKLMSEPLAKIADLLDNNDKADALLEDFMKGFIDNNPTLFGIKDGNKEPYRFKNYVEFNRNRNILTLEDDDIPDDIDEYTAEDAANAEMLNITFEVSSAAGYKDRTIKNASADATIAIATDFTTAGELLTKNSVLGQGKKYIAIDVSKTLKVSDRVVTAVVDRLNAAGARTLNIAGNGIYTMKGQYTQKEVDDYTYELLKRVTESPNLLLPIESVRTGGQTGFDEAGAKAGSRLGIPTLVLAPKGWKFRNVKGQDIEDEKAFKARFFIRPERESTVEVKGINIVSASKDELGRALTNPTHFNPKNPNATSSKRGGLGKFSALDNGIEYQGRKFKDVEEAYFALRVGGGPTQANIELITNLIEAKLRQYPILVEEVQKRGGLEFLKKSIHTYNASDDPENYPVDKSNKGWTSNSGNAFMNALIEAYTRVSPEPVSLPTQVNQQLTFEDAMIQQWLDEFKARMKNKYPAKEIQIDSLVTFESYKNSLSLNVVNSFDEFVAEMEEKIKNCV